MDPITTYDTEEWLQFEFEDLYGLEGDPDELDLGLVLSGESG